jgi:predicted nucleotidyltransferase
MWIAARFEIRVVECFFQRNVDFDQTVPIEMRDEYLLIWKGLQEEQRKNLVYKSVDQLDHFHKSSYSSADISVLQISKNKESSKAYCAQNANAQQMNWNEIMLKVIWQMNKDIKLYESLNDYEKIKEFLKEKMLTQSQGDPKAFIYMCVSPNLAESLKVERFFMNLMMRDVHDLYIEKNINDLCNDGGEVQEKKKKRVRNRNKKKKNKQGQIQEADSKNSPIQPSSKGDTEKGSSLGKGKQLEGGKKEERHCGAGKQGSGQSPGDEKKINAVLGRNDNALYESAKGNNKNHKERQSDQKQNKSDSPFQRKSIPIKNMVKNKSAIQKEFLESQNNLTKPLKNDPTPKQKTKSLLKNPEHPKTDYKRKPHEKQNETNQGNLSKPNKKYKFKLKRSNKDRRTYHANAKKDLPLNISCSRSDKGKLQRRNFAEKEQSLKEMKQKRKDKDLVSESSGRDQGSEQGTKVQKWTQSSMNNISSEDGKQDQSIPKTVQSEIPKKKRKKKPLKNPKWGAKPQPPLKWGHEDTKPINFISVEQRSVSTHNDPFRNNSKFFEMVESPNQNNFNFLDPNHNPNYNPNYIPMYFQSERTLNPFQPTLSPSVPFPPPPSSTQPHSDNIYFNQNQPHSDKQSADSHPQDPLPSSSTLSQTPNEIPLTPPKETPINKALTKKKLEISERTKEAFYEFTGNSVKKIIKDLKSQAEQLRPHREMILKRINKIIHKSFKTEEVNVVPYGSFETELLTPSSDLDLAITFLEPTITSQEEKHYFLETLESNLKLFSFVKTSKTVLSAIVPVIKIEADASIEFKDLPGRMEESRVIKVDIIVGSYESDRSINSAFKTTNFIKHVLSIYPSLFDVALFFKHILTSHGLSNAFQGGFNSYGFSILIISFMKFYSLDQSTDVGRITVEFLHFFCNIFDPSITAVNCKYSEMTPPQPFIPYGNFMRGAQLIIFDPTSLIPKNVTASCYKFYQIKEFFSQCLRKILNAHMFMEVKLLEKFQESINVKVSEERRVKVLSDEKLVCGNLFEFSHKIFQREFVLEEKKLGSHDDISYCDGKGKSVGSVGGGSVDGRGEGVEEGEGGVVRDIEGFEVGKEELVRAFDDMFLNLYEIVFSLNGKRTEQSSQESFNQGQPRADLDFDHKGIFRYRLLINNRASGVGDQE